MKIRTKFQLMAYFSTLMLIIVCLTMSFSYQNMRQFIHNDSVSDNLVKGIFELHIIANDYLISRSARAEAQWKLRYDSLNGLIQDWERQFSNERASFNAMRQNYIQLNSIFSRLSRNKKDVALSGGMVAMQKDLDKKIAQHLVARSQAMVSKAEQAHQENHESSTAAHINYSILIILLVVIMVFVLGAGLFSLSRSIAIPITKLTAGTKIIAAGNLNHQIAADSSDEIGDLSRAFNHMAGKLKLITVLRDDLEEQVMKRTAELVKTNEQLRKEIEERKRVEKTLGESESRFRGIFENTKNGVAVYQAADRGEDFIFADFNKGAEKIESVKRMDLIGKSVLDVFPGVKDFGLFDVFQRVWKTGNPEHYPISLYEDQRIKGWRDNFVYKLPSGEIVTVYTDETKNKQAEEEKNRLETQLQQSQKMESIGTLAGGIAHDFNNILFPMFGYLEMMLDDVPEGDPLHRKIAMVFNGAERARDLVKQILAFSRQTETERKALRVQLVIKEVLKLSRSSLPTTIRIHQNINNECDLVMADPTQIHQIAMNLVTNAYHAMEETGGKLTVSLKEVMLTAEDLKDLSMVSGPHVCLTVADTGVGIDQGIIAKIFDPYFTTKKEGKGTGLGLSVVHGIVKSHGGHISVYSEPGTGTEFKVYWPVIKPQQTAQKIENDMPIQKGTERVLLVDDQDAIVKMTRQILERLGYHVTTRTSSMEALEAFRTQPDKFDLVITDLTMPNMTGDKLVVELIKIRFDIPVILCTGFSEVMPEEKAAALGIRGILLKPIVMKDLSQMIRGALDNTSTQ